MVSRNNSANCSLTRIARIPGFRALCWDADRLYASRGYEVLSAKLDDPSDLRWRRVATFRPKWWRHFTASTKLTTRLCRDGFHALAIASSGGAVGAVAGAIVAALPGQAEFQATHTISRGTRPLHITAIPGGRIYWGEYFDNPHRDAVHIYASADGGFTWQTAYTFPKGAIRHVHNIVDDPWEECLWILTGDYGDECRILRAAYDLSRIESVLQGNQQTRAVAMIPTPDGLYFTTDTPLEFNYVYRLNREREVSRLQPINSSSIYGCRVGERVFFSTMVEPSKVNLDRHVQIYGGGPNSQPFSRLWEWEKDRLPMSLFQYGNAFLPDGVNSTPYLALTTAAVDPDDQTLSLYRINF
jgi:hypothetical protein